jgi:phosphinothricin acetyltransferase
MDKNRPDHGEPKKNILLEPLSPADRKPVIDIVNYYIENSFAAYPEHKVSYDFFDLLLKMTEGYPALVVKEERMEVVGFGMLHAYHPLPVFSKTAEISYVIKPDWINKGIGKRILKHLTQKAEEKGITSLLASISSLHKLSIHFHKKNGFRECGRFEKIGEKKGQVFDVIYMQKNL